MKNGNSKLNALVEHSYDGIGMLTATGDFDYVNPSAKRILGYTSEALAGTNWHTIIHPDDQQKAIAFLNTLAPQFGKTASDFFRIYCENGSIRTIRFDLTNLLQEPGINGYILNCKDVTEWQSTENRIHYSNRLYAFTSQISKAIINTPDQETIFKKACSIAIETGKFKMAWFGLLDQENKTINLIESCGIPEEDILNLSFSYERGGPIEKILAGTPYFVCNNIQNDLEIDKWKPYALRKGINSFIQLPIKKMGTVIGTFNLYAAEIDFFNAEEIQLLQEITEAISFSLDVFEKEKLRKQAEDKLKHSKLRLQQAQNMTHVGHWEVDFSTGIPFWSEEACRIYGFPIEENTHSFEVWLSSIHPDDLEYVTKLTEESNRTFSSAIFSHRIVRRDGTIRYLNSQRHFEFNNEGEPIALYGIMQDVTEIKEAEESLIQSEANLSQIIDLIPQSIFVKDFEGRYIFVNKNYAALYETTPEEIINTSQLEIIPVQEEGQRFLKDDREVMQTGKTKIIPEEAFTSPAGEKAIFHTIKVPYTPSRMNKTGVLGVITDITEQKIAEQQLKHSELRLNEAQAIARLGNWEHDIVSGTIIMSEQTCRIFGLPVEDNILNLDKWNSFVHPEDVAYLAKRLEEAVHIAGPENISFFYRIISTDGIIKHVYSRARVEFDNGGNPIYSRGILQDITEQKIAEQKIIKANRLYAVISAINQTIVHVQDEKTLFDEACRIAVDLGKFPLAFIGIPDTSERKLHWIAQKSAQADFEAISSVRYLDKGIIDKVVNSGEHQVMNELRPVSSGSEIERIAHKEGYKSYIVLPIKKSGTTYATFNLFSTEPHFFDDVELTLLKEVSGDISFTLNVFEKEKLRQATEKEIAASEIRLKESQAVGRVGSWENDIPGDIIIMSEETCRILGLPVEENICNLDKWNSFVHPEDVAYLAKKLAEAVHSPDGEHNTFFYRIISTAGIVKHVYSRARVEFDKGGNPIYARGILQDITEQKIAEQKIIKANRLYSFISAINQTIVHVRDEKTLFNEACRIAVDLGKFPLALIGVPDTSERKLHWIAQKSTNDDHELISHLHYLEDGPIDTVLNSGEIRTVNELTNESSHSEIERIAFKMGYQSYVVLPIKRYGAAYATFNIFSTEAHFFDDVELTLLKEVSGDISFALDVFENEKLRQAAETKTATSEMRLKEAQAVGRVGHWENDLTKDTIELSEEVCRIFGLPVEDNMLNLDQWNSFVHPEDQEYLAKRLAEALHSPDQEYYSYFYRIISTDGIIKHVFVRARAVFNDDGNVPYGYGILQDVTEQKIAEEKIIASEKRLKHAQAIAHLGDWEWNFSTNKVLLSDEACRIYGLSPEEKIQPVDFFASIVHPEDRNYVMELQQKAANTLQDAPVNFRLLLRDGTLKHVNMQQEFEFNADGKPLGVHGVVYDITQIKEAEESLIQSEANLRQIIDLIPQSIFVKDAEGRFVFVNKTYADLYGTTPEEMVNTSHIQRVSVKEQGITFINDDQEVILTGNTKIIPEVIFTNPAGKTGIFHTIKVPYTPSRTNKRGILGILTDITEQKQEAQQKEFDRNNLYALINTTKDMIWSVDNDLNLITFNEALYNATELFTGTKTEKGKPVISPRYPKEIQESSRALYNRALGGEMFTAIIPFPFRSETIWYECTYYPIRKEHTVVGVACFARDITAQKKAEEERAKILGDITRRNKDLEQFSFIVSHNLRSRIANMLGILEVIEVSELDETEEVILMQELFKSIKTIDTIIKDLNYILQVKNNEEVIKETVVFSDLLEEIKESMLTQIRNEEIHIVHDFTHINEIISIKGYLYSIFLNLISNSIKYRSPDKKLFIEISSALLDNKIQIVFKDNGLGIDLQKNGSKIFGLYNRFHKHIEGKGMGLYMVKTHVESLGGKIFISSQPGKGTIFTIEFDPD